jgi:response regulator RpfG family c-di-GMP phosphodiesterase
MEVNLHSCAFCGEAIARAPYARRGEEYCCEGCFLKQKEFQTLREERNEAYLALPEALVAALDEREHKTGLHSKRVACHTLVLARRFTDDPEVLRQVYWGSLLHDIGKIGIPDAVLLKPGPLTPGEWDVVRTHPEKGFAILAGVPFLAVAAQIVLCHEERFDGKGYAQGLAGEEIPWGARLFSVIDALDAITSDRPYRRGRSFEEAREIILAGAGTQFDPVAVEAFTAEEATLREMVVMKCGRMPLDTEEFRRGL